MEKTVSKRAAGANMLAAALVLLITVAGVLWQQDRIFGFLQANIPLNALIVAVFLVGVAYAMVSMAQLHREFGHIEKIRHRFATDQDEAWLGLEALRALPDSQARERLMLYASQTERGSPPDGDSHAEKVAINLALHTSITRYMAGLLVFLGLLGTFIGLLITLGGITDAIQTTASKAVVDDPAIFINSLIDGLGQPLQGMASAFSTSVFGLTTSLILGFLHLQLASVQTRFISRLELFDSSIFQPAFASSMRVPGAALRQDVEAGTITEGIARYLEATQRQLFDNLERLLQIVERTENMQANFREVMTTIGREIEMTNAAISRLSTNQDLIREAMSNMVEFTRSESDNQRLMLSELNAMSETMARSSAQQQSQQTAAEDQHEALVRVLRQELGALCKIAAGGE